MFLFNLSILASLIGSIHGSSVHNCSELQAPNFGAISCATWDHGRTCSISCREHYDFPWSHLVPRFYLCAKSTGRWNHAIVPDCVWREYGSSLQMNGNYYFRGECSTAKTVIKSKFLEVIKQNEVCPSEEECTVENVNVRCGNEPEPDETWDF